MTPRAATPDAMRRPTCYTAVTSGVDGDIVGLPAIGTVATMDALVTIANLLFVSAYFVRDVRWLRGLALCGACCLATYFYTLPQPLMHVVYWNMVYVAINAVWLTRLLLHQSARSMAGSGFDRRRR